ncbi:sugar transferase [Phosphitispora sp. TUW77]|uniref:sugar transferase n=1 Tax=Phosphitispora sp. TUW77 TaxID=3152361 RepID=UPI003AB210CE
MDFILSLCAIIVLSPVLIIVAVMVRVKLGSPVLFKQQRPGLNEKIFTMYKFRTMTDERDENGELLPDQVRLTKFGKFLRSTSLDELPELFNIIKGDMSVVGPRPQLIRDVVFMTPEQRLRHSVLPGLSGLAQINGRNCILWEEKFRFDLVYIEKITFLGDWKIIFRTIAKAFKREGISSEGMETAEDLGEYLLRKKIIDEDTYNAGMEKSRNININMSNHWKKYNHALIPTTPPHITPNTPQLSNIIKNRALLARWTSDFDCGYETAWWYCIKDDKFNLSSLNAKKRYEINRGLKHIEVLRINTNEYAIQLADISEIAYSLYPPKYRPQFNKEKAIEGFLKTNESNNLEYWGMFDRENGTIVGYSICRIMKHCVNLMTVKVSPYHLKTGANAALIFKLLEEYINSGLFKYIYDGERNIVHQTNYQNYLEKYFGFRKAYCKLHIQYNPVVALIVKMLYPFKKILKNFSSYKFIYNVSSVLDMEEIKRSFQ